MDDLHVLAPDIKYRREWFGGVLYIGHLKSTHYFNHTAALAIEQFARPALVYKVQQGLQRVVPQQGLLSKFFDDLKREGIICRAIGHPIRAGETFFTDITEFTNDRLYAPLAIEAELTLKCMRHCSYCAYESSPHVVTARELTQNQWNSLLIQLRTSGVFYIRFTGGDPLTRIDTLEILAQADTLGFGIALASDLTILSAEHARALGSLKNLIALQTTLDGSSSEIADALRGHGNFRQVVRGLDLLQEYQVPLIVGTVITRLNAHDVYDIAKVLSRWDRVGYCVSPLYDAGRGRTLRHLIPSDDELAIAYEQFAAAAHDNLIRPADPAWEIMAEDLSPEERYYLWQGQPWLVRSPDRLMRIDPAGRAYTSIHLKEVIGSDIYIGNVLESEILELWHRAPLLNKLRGLRQRNHYFGDMIDIRKIQKEDISP